MQKKSSASTVNPVIIPRADHTLSRKDIDPNALKVLYRLYHAGFSAYLVGGCVRDLLLGYHPKDFDIATNARPEEVRRLFKNCRLIGKRFRLAHILFGKHIIEVATFRTHHTNASHEHHAKTHEGMIIRDNVYGDIEDDAARRDFSINALYYNIADFSVVDYANGMPDLKTKTLRMIGNPEERFQEDPVRLLRAARFIGKLGLNVEPEVEQHLLKLAHLLQKVSPSRLFQEILKFFQEGAAANTFKMLEKYHFLGQVFPETAAHLSQPETRKLISELLVNTDKRFQEEKSISPAFLFAAFLWRPVINQATKSQTQGASFYAALEKSTQASLKSLTEQLALPRYLSSAIREIHLLQFHLTRRKGFRVYRLLEHPRFRAGYDLLILRSHAGEPVQELATWWTEFQQGSQEEKDKLIKAAAKSSKGKRPRKRIHPKSVE